MNLNETPTASEQLNPSSVQTKPIATPHAQPESLKNDTTDGPSQTQIPRLQTVLDNLSAADDAPITETSGPRPVSPVLIAPAGFLALPPVSTPGAAAPEPSRQLDVSDALSYLDAVKFQFQDKPDVYNYFLDIMKDFKSQAIDTPGVIDRVSMLFNGHSDLIQGFNTFLPPGYRIDISKNPAEANLITVTTPSGTTTQSTDEMHPHMRGSPSGHLTTSYNSLGWPASLPHRTTHLLPAQSLVASATTSRPVTPHSRTPLAQPPAPGSPMMYGSAHAASFLGGLGNRGASDKAGPQGSDEFHHAIQFVNKIKTRYEDDTDTYKQFLEILHTHRKEHMYQSDSQVYAQVQILFKDAPDLLAEFKDFLPSAGFSGMLPPGADPPGPPGPPASNAAWAIGTSGGSDRADKRSAKPDAAPPPLAPKRKKRPSEKDAAPAPPQSIAAAPKAGPNRAKKLKHSHNKAEPPSPVFAPHLSHPSSPAQPHVHAHTHHAQPHAHAPHAGQPVAAAHAVGVPMTAAEELMFFDRAKKVLESRDAYEDFLKLLNMYSKDIIDAKVLVQKVEAFLGEGELLGQFKDLLAWDDKKNTIEDGPPGAIRSWDSLSRPPRETEERHGPSYRRLPLGETTLACSGRDELCRSVLNDVWVSHPTWASEEAGFVSHKKNSYEEALHKSEEERHEYQFYIEIISRTISLLQPLHDRISEMSAEERHAFRLPPDFGGSSKSIYQRAIKKVYGRDAAGLEVLQALQDCPAVAVPVVLQRLKQKNEEWRRAQREWNRVWREVDARNFFKSLDHQGITFKANDKKNITTKSFVTEIENARAEFLERHTTLSAGPSDKATPSPGPSGSWHLEYHMKDTAVLQDAVKMVFSYLDRSPVQYSTQERRSVEKLLRKFMPLFCMLPAAEFDAPLGSPIEGTDAEDVPGDDIPAASGDDADDGPSARNSKSGKRSAGSGSGSGSGPGGGVPPGDLRRKLLKTAQEKAAKIRSSSGSRHPSPGLSLAGSEDAPGAASVKAVRTKLADVDDDSAWGDEWIRLVPVEDKDDMNLGKGALLDQRPFFSNTTFYTLLRLLQLLYSRLLMFKEIAARLSSERKRSSTFVVNPVAEELGLVDSSGPGSVLTVATLGQREASARPEVHFYEYFLDACEKLFEGEMDQAAFEENMRFLFGTKAFHIFTVDKLVAALIKQIQTVVIDNKCQELLSLLTKSRSKSKDQYTVRDLIHYRREAEQYLGTDDHLYRIEWSPDTKAMQIQLLGSEDPSVDLLNGTAVGRWRNYVDSYVLNHPTELVSGALRGRIRRLFLQRTRESYDEDTPRAHGPIMQNRLEIRISLGTHRIFFKSGTEDMMWQRRTKEEESELKARAVARHEERKASTWLAT